MHPYARLQTEIGRPSNIHVRGRPDGDFDYPVMDDATYREYALHCLRIQQKPERLSDRPDPRPAAYVSDGRWVVDCLCGAGNAVEPEWGLAICCECGMVSHPIIPPDWQAAEVALLRRVSPHNRHWFPENAIALRYGFARRETLADLHEQNKLMERTIR